MMYLQFCKGGQLRPLSRAAVNFGISWINVLDSGSIIIYDGAKLFHSRRREELRLFRSNASI